MKENVAAFVNMTPETFSGVYANAVKETHWLSYPNYAALVSGSSFITDDLANGKTDVFINLDLKTLETHSGPGPRHHRLASQRDLQSRWRGDGSRALPPRRGRAARLSCASWRPRAMPAANTASR